MLGRVVTVDDDVCRRTSCPPVVPNSVALVYQWYLGLAVRANRKDGFRVGNHALGSAV